MFIKIEGMEPQFKVYKMMESVEGKIYIGKTKKPLQERMDNHRRSQLYADKHFSNVGWNNVTVEIIDIANNDEESAKKENIRISECYKNNKNLLLNKSNFFDFSHLYASTQFEPVTKYIYFSELDIFPDNRCFYCQRKMDEYCQDVFKFIKYNKYIIKQVDGARKYISKCI